MIEIKALEWREDWGGSLDDIPKWRAKTPWGSVTVSVAGYRDENGRPYERHSDVPEELKTRLIAERQSDYEARIRSALVERKAEPVGWETEAEWELEQRAFAAFNDAAIPEPARKLILDLWQQYCLLAEPPTPPAAPVRAEPVATVEIRDLKGGGGMRGLGHIQPEHWWAKQPSGTYYIYPAPQTMAALSASPSPVDSRDDRDFLHRLIENAFSWALQDCNYLNPKYMDRLIDCTHDGMKPEHAAVWNATAPEQEARALAAKEHQPSTDVKSDECGHPFDDTFKTATECIAANKCLCGLKHDRGAAAKEQQP